MSGLLLNMDLSSPVSSVVPSAHGPVLAVLARTDQPLSGRQVAALTEGRAGQWRVNEVLGQLAQAGIVLREDRPPAKLYRLNRDHVAAEAVVALAGLREELLRRIREHVGGWAPPAQAVWLFGSAARGEGGPESDIDLLVVRGDDVDVDDPSWTAQVADLGEQIWRWSGNSCEVVELAAAEVVAMVARDERLVGELRADAVALAGSAPRTLLRRRGKR
jgi:hypothetical protein